MSRAFVLGCKVTVTITRDKNTVDPTTIQTSVLSRSIVSKFHDDPKSLKSTAINTVSSDLVAKRSEKVLELLEEVRLPCLAGIVGLFTSIIITSCRNYFINSISGLSDKPSIIGLILPLLGSALSCILLKWRGDDINKGYLIFNEKFSLKRQVLRWFGAVVACCRMWYSDGSVITCRRNWKDD